MCLTGAVVFACELGDTVGSGVRKPAGFKGEAESKEGATAVKRYTYTIFEDVENHGAKDK